MLNLKLNFGDKNDQAESGLSWFQIRVWDQRVDIYLDLSTALNTLTEVNEQWLSNCGVGQWVLCKSIKVCDAYCWAPELNFAQCPRNASTGSVKYHWHLPCFPPCQLINTVSMWCKESTQQDSLIHINSLPLREKYAP